MRYHYEKPSIYLSMYGEIYICDHPVYSRCTLYQIDKKGLAVIQQRYDPKTKHTWWTEIDPWITDDLYLHPKFKEFFLMFVLDHVETVHTLQLQYGKLCGL